LCLLKKEFVLKAVKLANVFFSKDKVLYPLNKDVLKYQINYPKHKVDEKQIEKEVKESKSKK